LDKLGIIHFNKSEDVEVYNRDERMSRRTVNTPFSGIMKEKGRADGGNEFSDMF